MKERIGRLAVQKEGDSTEKRAGAKKGETVMRERKERRNVTDGIWSFVFGDMHMREDLRTPYRIMLERQAKQDMPILCATSIVPSSG